MVYKSELPIVSRNDLYLDKVHDMLHDTRVSQPRDQILLHILMNFWKLYPVSFFYYSKNVKYCILCIVIIKCGFCGAFSTSMFSYYLRILIQVTQYNNAYCQLRNDVLQYDIFNTALV